jgi:hypothetical protein
MDVAALLAKPIDLDHLLAVVEQHSPPDAQTPRAQPRGRATLAGGR